MYNDNNNRAQLGCGTLILIAIIVMIFSGGGQANKTARDVDGLREDVQRLEEKVDVLTEEVRALRQGSATSDLEAESP